MMTRLDRVYLAHEYLDEHWELFQFSDVVARLADAKLAYVASATMPENLDQYAVPNALLPVVAELDDPVLKETVRDYAANKRFRRDLFARGTATLTDGERRRILSDLSFALAVPRKRMVFRFMGPLSELTGRDDLYAPLVDLLAEKNAGFDELLALPAFGEPKIGMLLDCLALLVHSGQVLPIVGPSPDPAPAQRFNRMIVGHARTGRIYGSLAAPVARTGIPVSDFGLLALAAVLDGKDTVPAAAQQAMSILKILGRRPMKDGRLIQDDGEATIFLAEQMQPIIEEQLPVWRRLGVL